MRQAVLGMLMAAVVPGMAAAEDAWIRIEAKRGPAAEAALTGWRAKFDDVQSFALPNGMTGIALGPQDAAAAAARMAQLKAAGTIPADSFLTAPGGTAPLAGALAAAGEVAPTSDTAAAEAAPAPAATGTHIQVQATPGRISAGEALAHWREPFPEAGLWRLPGGMFAVALAPQDAAAAAARLAALKAEGRLPGDAYLAQTAQLGQMIEAGGVAPEARAGDQAAAAAPPAAAVADGAAATPAPAGTDASTDPSPAPTAPTETAAGSSAAVAAPADAATASTAGLTGAPAQPPAPPAPAVMPPLDQVQSALLWAGFYDGPIDGKSGPGTRAAIGKEIAAAAPGTPPAEAMVALIERREAWRREMGLTLLTDPASGLQIMAPMGRLTFDRAERGLSIYGPKDGSGAALILTRHPGGQQEMLDFAGLVTALGWVPHPNRDVTKGRITMDGTDAQHIGHAEASVTDGEVRGWVLIWPAADADNARRLALDLPGSLALAPRAEAQSGAQPTADGSEPAPATPPTN